MAGDAAQVSVFVRVPPDVAFEVFTTEIDLWWKQGPKFRVAGRQRGQLVFEPGENGRLFESFPGGTFEVGRVIGWEPPARLELEWRGPNYDPGQKTFVEVRFVAANDGTMVTVRHRGFAALPDGHPVRHGQDGAAFARMLGMWWGELMTSLREHATRPASTG